MKKSNKNNKFNIKKIIIIVLLCLVFFTSLVALYIFVFHKELKIIDFEE